MKSLLIALILLFGTASFAATGEFVADLPDTAFIPQGFDSNDNSQLVITGLFRDSCQKEGPLQVQVRPDVSEIVVKVYKYIEDNPVCFDVVQPYVRTINLGILPQANYSVKFLDEQGDRKDYGFLPVTLASRVTADDFIYAPVQEATYKFQEGRATVLVSGEIYNTCLEWSHAIVNHVDDSNVIDILPILKRNEEECVINEVGIPFRKVIQLGNVPAGKYLLNIRKMNGRSHFKVAKFR